MGGRGESLWQGESQQGWARGLRTGGEKQSQAEGLIPRKWGFGESSALSVWMLQLQSMSDTLTPTGSPQDALLSQHGSTGTDPQGQPTSAQDTPHTQTHGQTDITHAHIISHPPICVHVHPEIHTQGCSLTQTHGHRGMFLSVRGWSSSLKQLWGPCAWHSGRCADRMGTQSFRDEPKAEKCLLAFTWPRGALSPSGEGPGGWSPGSQDLLLQSILRWARPLGACRLHLSSKGSFSVRSSLRP